MCTFHHERTEMAQNYSRFLTEHNLITVSYHNCNIFVYDTAAHNSKNAAEGGVWYICL